MRSHNSSILFLLRLAGLLTLLCLSTIGLAGLVGKTIQGTTIAFVPQFSFDKSFHDTFLLHLMDIRLGLIKQVSDVGTCCPVWSPDGNRIAFIDYSGQPFVWSMSDGTTRSIAPSGFRAATGIIAWSPSGDAIVVWGSGTEQLDIIHDLYILKPDENSQTRLTFFRSEGSYDPVWSLDSRYIIFHNFDATLNSTFYRIESDGKNLEEIIPFGNSAIAPELSPDRSQIVYVLELNDNRDLYVMKADGTGRRRLTWTEDSEMYALWSPDGTHLLFPTYNDNYSVRRLEVMNVDGTGRQILAENIILIDSVSWSPDGRQILYTAQVMGQVGLYVINADGSNPHLLVQNQSLSFYSAWRP